MAVTINGIDSVSPPSFLSIDGSANVFLYVFGTLTLSGSYVSGGDTLDLTTMKIPGTTSCISFLAFSTGGVLAVQYVPLGSLTTALASWKLKIATTFGSELGAGAYPAPLIADTIAFQAVFTKNR
jgi:hypothetical protein